jgi:hypothetical protein
LRRKRGLRANARFREALQKLEGRVTMRFHVAIYRKNEDGSASFEDACIFESDGWDRMLFWLKDWNYTTPEFRVEIDFF